MRTLLYKISSTKTERQIVILDMELEHYNIEVAAINVRLDWHSRTA